MEEMFRFIVEHNEEGENNERLELIPIAFYESLDALKFASQLAVADANEQWKDCFAKICQHQWGLDDRQEDGERQAYQASFIRAIVNQMGYTAMVALVPLMLPIMVILLTASEKHTRLAALSCCFTMLHRDVIIPASFLEEVETVLIYGLEVILQTQSMEVLQDCEEQLHLIKEFAMLTGRTPNLDNFAGTELQTLISTIIQPPRLVELSILGIPT